MRADPWSREWCCGEAEQEDGGKGDDCTYPLTVSATPDTRALACPSLLASTRTQSYIRTKNLARAAVGTFTNNPEEPFYNPEMATLLAGESGPDARAEKASAAPAKPGSGSGTKHPCKPSNPPVASLPVTRHAALSTRQTSAATPLTERMTRSDVRNPHRRPFSPFSSLEKTWWVVRVLEEIWL